MQRGESDQWSVVSVASRGRESAGATVCLFRGGLAGGVPGGREALPSVARLCCWRLSVARAFQPERCHPIVP